VQKPLLQKKTKEQRALKEKACDFLARREHARAELVEKLSARGYASSDITTCLDELCAQNLQSDARFAAAYTLMRIQRGYGPMRIRAELQARGVDPALIKVALADEAHEWPTLLQRAHQKRFGSNRPDTPTELAQRIKFLQYRGFLLEDILALFR
jgi:regulatory protein